MGNQVTLNGIQVDWNTRIKKYGTTGEATYPEAAWFTEADIIRMKQNGANVVELHFNPLTDLMPTRNVVNEAYFATWIDTWVRWCTQNEMYCIIDVSGIGARWDWEIEQTFPDWLWSGLYSKPTTQYQYEAIMRDFFDLDVTKQNVNREAFTNLWRFIAGRYKDNPYVMFSIMNEPFVGSHLHLNPSNDNIALAKDYSTFMTTIIDAIRAQGAQQLVYVNHPWLHAQDWTWAVQPIYRDNIVWEVHRYVGSGSDLNSWKYDLVTGIDSYVDLFMNKFGKPLFVGEYGIDPMSDILSVYPTNWQWILSEQVAYLHSKQIAGIQWHQWGYLAGENYNYSDNYWSGSLTAAQSEWIVQTVLG
jgi:hypothetical protein